jgi:transcription elongation GreA/GreB family factor
VQKDRLLDQLAALLKTELEVAERLARETADAANHPEARPDSDKDTRKIELSYLAAGQAARAKELETALAVVATLPRRRFAPCEAVQSGARVELELGGEPKRVHLCPVGGGTKLEDDKGEVSVITPQSPLGRGLLGRTQGDGFELVVAGRNREVEIVGIE